MVATTPAELIIEYIRTGVLRDSDAEVGLDTPLVSSGLIDSFALVDILAEVEDVTGLRIPANKVAPRDMDTVALMLATAKRLGRSRQE